MWQLIMQCNRCINIQEDKIHCRKMDEDSWISNKLLGRNSFCLLHETYFVGNYNIKISKLLQIEICEVITSSRAI